jgi:hypothetical protein
VKNTEYLQNPYQNHTGKYEENRNRSTTSNIYNEERQLQNTARTALQIQHELMNMSIKHCHTYSRWKKIQNFFIEKTPGKPLLEELCVIHIYEMDWNLVSKYFVSHKLHSKAY